MSWFHNSQLRDWVHGCVTAAITQAPHAPSSLPSLPSPSNDTPSSKIISTAAAISAVPSPLRHTNIVVDKTKVVIEVLPPSPLLDCSSALHHLLALDITGITPCRLALTRCYCVTCSPW
jgi:hypothetical protein